MDTLKDFEPDYLASLTDVALHFRRRWTYDIGDVDAFINVLNEIECRKAA